MTDLDAPAHGNLEGGVQIVIPGRQRQHWPWVKFRGVCGAGVCFAIASCVDQGGCGGGSTPSGWPSCDEVGHELMEINGRQSCVRTIHAEENAIVTAARHGVPLIGGTLYTTASTCYNCLKRVSQVGISRIVYGTEYIGGTSVDLQALAQKHNINMEYLPLGDCIKLWEPAPPAVSIKQS